MQLFISDKIKVADTQMRTEMNWAIYYHGLHLVCSFIVSLPPSLWLLSLSLALSCFRFGFFVDISRGISRFSFPKFLFCLVVSFMWKLNCFCAPSEPRANWDAEKEPREREGKIEKSW